MGTVSRTICLVLFMLISGLALTGCIDTINSGGSSSKGLIGSAAMALSVDSTTLKPLATTNVFKKDTPAIYCSVLLLEAPGDTIVSADWIYVRGALGQENVKMRSKAITTDGPRYLSFSLVRPGEAWAVGEYKVVLSVDGKEQLSLPFKVE